MKRLSYIEDARCLNVNEEFGDNCLFLYEQDAVVLNENGHF